MVVVVVVVVAGGLEVVCVGMDVSRWWVLLRRSEEGLT